MTNYATTLLTQQAPSKHLDRNHRLNAESIFASALICPFCTFLGAPSLSLSSTPPNDSSPSPLLLVNSVELRPAASSRCDSGDFACVPLELMLPEYGPPPLLLVEVEEWLLLCPGRSLIVGKSFGFRTRCLRGPVGGMPNMSPLGLG